MRIETVTFPIMRQLIKRPKAAQLFFRLDSWGNPFSEGANADPYQILDLVHAGGPVVYKRLYQQWFVTGYEEAREILSSPDALVAGQVDMLLDVPPYTKLNERSESFLRHILLLIDPPDHTRLRRLVNRAFTPRQVARLDERMAEIIDDLVADLDDEPELMHAFASPFPVYVIAELLGVPTERWQWIRKMARLITELFDPFRAFDPDEMNTAIDEFHTYVVDLAADRRRDPKHDLLTGLAEAEEDGDRLSEDELVGVFGTMLFAGHETTAGLLGNSLINLARFPEQRRWIRENPDNWPNAVEELIRFDTSVKSDPRVSDKPITLGDHTIPAGENVVVLLGYANRDPRRFDNPDALMLDRVDPAPISFGHGIHYCIGANLARMEIRLGLQRLIDELGDYEVVEDDVVWKPSISLRGPLRLPVRRG